MRSVKSLGLRDILSPYNGESNGKEHEKYRDLSTAWTPTVCKMMAFMAVIMGLGWFRAILLHAFGAQVEGSELGC